MSTYKRVSGNLIIQTLSANNVVTIESATVVMTGNLTVSGNVFNTGIGGGNVVRLNSNFVVEADGSSLAMTTVGNLTIAAVANQAYQFQAFLPVVPNGATATEFAVLFSSGNCYFTTETQATATSAWDVATSQTSDNLGTTVNMTGTTLRSVRITGVFSHTSNVNVSIRANTQSEDINVLAGAYLSYTRTL